MKDTHWNSQLPTSTWWRDIASPRATCIHTMSSSWRPDLVAGARKVSLWRGSMAKTLVDAWHYRLCTPGGGLARRLPPHTHRLYTPGKGLARCLPPVYMWPHVRRHINTFIVHMSTPDIFVHHVYGFIRNHKYGYIDHFDTWIKTMPWTVQISWRVLHESTTPHRPPTPTNRHH